MHLYISVSLKLKIVLGSVGHRLVSVAILPHVISWFPRLSLIFQKRYVPKTGTVSIARWEGGKFLLKRSNKLLNQCLSVRPKFACPVMKNSLFSKISPSRCLPNLSPEDRDIPFPSAFFLGIPDGGQVPKPSLTYRCQNPLFWTSETRNFPYRFFSFVLFWNRFWISNFQSL